MNENQQELLNYINQNNLDDQAARVYLRFNGSSQEDKDAVVAVLDQRAQQKQDEQLQQAIHDKEERIAQTQERLDNIVPNVREATQALDQARAEYDEVGWFGNILQEAKTGFTEPGAYSNYLDQVLESGKVYQESRQLLNEAGKANLANMLKLPSYGSWGGIVDIATLNVEEMVRGYDAQLYDLFGADEKARESVDLSQAAGEIKYNIREMEEMAQQFSDLTFGNFLPSVGAFMGEQIPMLALLRGAGIAAGPLTPAAAGTTIGGRAAILGKNTLKLATTAPSIVNMALAGGRTFADIYDDPNLSPIQKHVHASLVGAIEGTGDMVLGAIAGVVPMSGVLKGTAITSKFGKIVGANAVTRSSAKFIGAATAESAQEISQEIATIMSEEAILGRDVSGAETLTRIKEAGLGGLVMGGAFRVGGAPIRAYQNIRMMADRPGDRTHLESTEAFNRAKEIIEKALSGDLSDAQLKTLDAELQDIMSKERKRVADRQKAYRVLRRRDPESFDRVMRIDYLVNRKLAQLEVLESDKAKESVKKDLQALIEERNSITAEYDGQENTLTPVERFEDAIEDLDQGLAEAQEDLDAVANMDPETDGDLMVLHFLQQRISGMKARKKRLMKALGDVQAATDANDAEAIASAMRELDTILSESLPSEGKTTPEQLNDDASQDEEEQAAEPAAEEDIEGQTLAEAAEGLGEDLAETVRQGLEAQQDKAKPTEDEGSAIVISTTEGLSQSDIENLPTHLVKTLQNLSSTGIDVEIIVHDTRAGLLKAHPRGKTNSLAFYLPRTRQIHLAKDATLAQVKHEFAHALVHDLLKDATYRREIYDQIAKKWDPELMEEIRLKYVEQYEDMVTGPELERLTEEEVIVAWMERYGNEDGVNMLKKRGIYRKVVDFFNNIFRKKYGRYAEQYVINNETDFVGLLEAFAAAIEVGSTLTIDANRETEGETALDMVSRAYPDMVNKAVTFTVSYPNRNGEFTSSNKDTRVFKDYFHFRNYWASMTGNGKHSWITNIQYIGEDGKVKKVNIPSPKKDRQGNIIDMEPKLYSWHQKEVYSYRGYFSNIDALKSERNRVKVDIDSAERSNKPVPEELLKRREEINDAIREMNELYDKKDPYIRKYDAIRERIAGPRPDPRKKEPIDPKFIGQVKGNDFLRSLRPDHIASSLDKLKPDTEASASDNASDDFVLDSVDGSEGAWLKEEWEKRGKKTKSLESHKGKRVLVWQYDKTESGSGPGYDVPNAVSSHATRAQANEMMVMLEQAAKRQALEERSSNVTVVGLISVQSDSVLSNPRAISDIVNHYNTLDENQKVEFLNKFGEVFSTKLTEGLGIGPDGKLKTRDSVKGKTSKALLNLVDRVYKGHMSAGNIKDHTGFMAMSKNFGTSTVVWPDFAKIATAENRDALFIELMEGMNGLSIRSNNEIITALFNSSKTSAGREFGMTTSELKSRLESEALKSVPTADIVGFVEIPIRVSNWDNPKLARVETSLKVDKVEAAFDQAIISGDGTEFFGLPQSVPYDVVGGDISIESIAKKLGVESITISEAQALVDDEAKLKEAVKVILKPNARGVKNQEWTSYSEVIKKLDSLKEQLVEAEESGSSSVYTKISAEILGIENALKTHAKKVKELQDPGRGIPQSIRMARQSIQEGMIPVDMTDPVSLDETTEDGEITLDSVQDNSWAPRKRSAFQQKIDWVRLKFRDKYAPIMMAQEDIEAARGGRVESSQNFKRAEELMYGKAHNDLEKLEQKVDRLKEAMKSGNINPDKLNDFLYARHAAERNAMLKERDGVDNGSGLTDAEAEAILASFTATERAALEKAAAIADEISQDTRDSMRKFGLEADRRIDAFESMFTHYVPLGGFAEDSKDVDNYPYPTGGVGFHVKGSTTKKAKGRKTPPANILAQIIQQNASIKIKGRRNEALQSLFNLVSANPNTKLWNTSDNIPVNDADRSVGVRINGEQKFIIFKDESLAKNLKGMGVQKLDALSRLMAAPANFLRAAFTTRNPEFIISNFSRDILSAIPNALAEADLPDGAIKGKHAVARKIIQRVPQTLKALIKSDVMGQDLDPVTAKYLAEFKEDGGQTGWGFVKPLQQIAAELDAETNEANKAKKAIKWMKDNSLQHIENMNDAFENSIRLSSYIEAREAGASREDAAQLAKNITVNFNKSGEYGAVANAYYLFFNASIQGSARVFRSLGKLKTVENMDGTFSKELSTPQKVIIGLALTSGLLAMINMALSDEDEDGELFYNKIPDYEKERNLIMMYDGKNYIKIPLPYGYNVFSNFGTALAETMAGERDATDAMWFVANSAFSSFSPVSFGQSDNFAKYLAKGAAPTVFKPLIEMAVNETYFGSKVYQDQFPLGAKRPDSELSFRSPALMKDLFKWMNEATGGSKQRSGSVDLNPDLFWYPFEYYIGGMGQFGVRASKAAYTIEEMIRTGEKPVLEANDIPFLRKIYGEPSKYYDFDLYDRNKEEVMQLYKELKNNKQPDRDRYKGVAKLDKKMKTIEKKLKALRERRRGFEDLPYIERVNKTAEVQERERILIMEYNELYEKLRGQ